MVASVYVYSTFYLFYSLYISIMYFHLVSAVHTKNYRSGQKWSNANKGKLAILAKAASTMTVDSTEYVKAAAVPTEEAECHHAAMTLKAQPLSSPIGKHDLKIFTFDELQRATRNFRPSAMLGYSDGESVYKGWVDSASYAPSGLGIGIAVAVKILNTDKVKSLKEWQAEVNRGKFSHPRVVKLLGYCSEDGRLLLVHEYIPKINLAERLGYHPLQWVTAMKIAVGVAQGLAFLHTVENTLVYRTLNASNVLLNKDFEAELYFGLATLGSTPGRMTTLESDMLTSHLMTPEYVATGHWCFESDVYALGVLMLRMIVGSRFFMDNNQSPPWQSLTESAKPILCDCRKLQESMDPWFENGNPPKGVGEAGELILSCLEIDPLNRPSMIQVVASLERINSMNM